MGRDKWQKSAMSERNDSRNLVVIGGSAGGIAALQTILSGLDEHFPAAICVVLHRAPGADAILERLLDQSGALTARRAEDGLERLDGHVYLAPPTDHLAVTENVLRVVHGPEENMSRPSIDVLFRSAAVCCGPRTIGVILTGMLNDGAAGLSALVRCGGMAIVQDPNDAAYPEMPESALERLGGERVARVPLEEIADKLNKLAGQPAGPRPPVPSEIRLEARIALGDVASIAAASSLGTPSPFSCPRCDGTLWEISADEGGRYRCHTGHAYSLDALLRGQSDKLERALWMAMRQFRERAESARRMAKRSRLAAVREDWEAKASDADSHAEVIQQTLLGLSEGVLEDTS